MKHIRNILVFSLIFLLGFPPITKCDSIDKQYLTPTSVNNNKKIIYLTFDDGTFVNETISTGNGIPYIIFLMHNNNSNRNTCLVLLKIIPHYKNLGYEFRTITSSTPEFYWHPLK